MNMRLRRHIKFSYSKIALIELNQFKKYEIYYFTEVFQILN
jgi:hypothetical protein